MRTTAAVLLTIVLLGCAMVILLSIAGLMLPSNLVNKDTLENHDLFWRSGIALMIGIMATVGIILLIPKENPTKTEAPTSKI